MRDAGEPPGKRNLHRRAVLAGMAGLSSFVGAPASASVSVPSSQRSRRAEERGAMLLSPALRSEGSSLGAPVFIQIFKRPSVLKLFMRQDHGERFVPIAHFPVCARSGDIGPKQREGDNQAPEGLYTVRPRQMNPHSSFHLSFNLGFPNAAERARGWTGSFLMVHGGCASIGCYAMTDPIIEQIWAVMAAAFRAGQPAIDVHCFPFSLSETDSEAHRGSRFSEYWAEIAPAYQIFDRTQRPPRVRIRNGRYLVSEG